MCNAMLWENYIENHKLGQDHVCSSTYHVAAGLRPCLCLVSWLLLSQLVVAASLPLSSVHEPCMTAATAPANGWEVIFWKMLSAFSLQPSRAKPQGKGRNEAFTFESSELLYCPA